MSTTSAAGHDDYSRTGDDDQDDDQRVTGVAATGLIQRQLNDPSIISRFLRQQQQHHRPQQHARAEADNTILSSFSLSTGAGGTATAVGPWRLLLKVSPYNNQPDLLKNDDSTRTCTDNASTSIPAVGGTTVQPKGHNKNKLVPAKVMSGCYPMKQKNEHDIDEKDVNHETNVDETEHYLDIRRRQNETFCQQRLLEGNRLLREAEHAAADESGTSHRNSNSIVQQQQKEALQAYQQGLDLMPHHADLLVAFTMTKLLQQKQQQQQSTSDKQDKYDKALSMLQKVVQENPQHKTAARCLAQVQQEKVAALTANQKKTQKSLDMMRDVLFEQSLRGQEHERPATAAASSGPKGGDGQDEDYPLLAEPSSGESVERLSRKHGKRSRRDSNRDKYRSDDDDDEKRSKRRRKDREKRHGKTRRRRRHRYEDEVDIYDVSHDDESIKSLSKLAKDEDDGKKLKTKVNKRNHPSSDNDDDDASSSSSDTRERRERRRRRRRRREKKKHRKRKDGKRYKRRKRSDSSLSSNKGVTTDDDDDASGGSTVDSLRLVRRERQQRGKAMEHDEKRLKDEK